MISPKTVLALFAMIAYPILAQQAATSQPTPAQAPTAPATTAPCSKATPDQPHKDSWLQKKARAFACKQNKNLCDLPSSPTEITGVTPDTKPCPASTVGGAVPAKAPAQPAPAPSASATANGKPVYVCPPKATLIPGFPYCLNADRSVVDAIPLPTSLSAPVPTASPAPASAQH